ncbi:PREDICTED: transcription factor bHLH99 [Brassica oleracea var. oleracea]|uniref:BHLH domain-containing protein n=1 Tax=Brassica oleracea var. oleracea TaxID=109376 RepID=A0A0D2ZQ38_BRAOL|nr:PREDICTED: transcription factor bHLH99 [Brassica oleracea var. oleracea]
MMFQHEYPYGFSLMETSSSYEVLDYKMIVGSPPNPISFASSLATLSSSIAEQQSNSTDNLYSLQARGGFGEEPPRKKRRRRRTRSEQMIEEKENQRMNHIAVERNRRRQMNHFLSILKAMMPLSYSQRSDQASIIEGTINYLKKQEQLLQSFEAQLKPKKPNQPTNIFSDFFNFPQYSTAIASSRRHHNGLAVVADVEVTMVEMHANIKVLTKTRPRLLLKMINEFDSLGLTIFHLNLTTSNNMSLFTFSVKVDEACRLTTTANEVADAVHEVVSRIHKEH